MSSKNQPASHMGLKIRKPKGRNSGGTLRQRSISGPQKTLPKVPRSK